MDLTKFSLFFGWLRQAILTNKERVCHHLISDGQCSICFSSEESTMHVLRDYPFAKQVCST